MNNESICLTEAEDAQLPIAAGAEMISLLEAGYMNSCKAASCGKRVVLCKGREPYLPPIGQNIRRLRVAGGMTQRQLAYHLRVSMQAVSKWERGMAYPDMSLLVPIAGLFGITLDELFGCR